MGRSSDNNAKDECARQLAAIREVLWPGGDADHQWSPDTLDDIARIVGPPPPDPEE